jgi:hypothetical protein
MLKLLLNVLMHIVITLSNQAYQREVSLIQFKQLMFSFAICPKKSLSLIFKGYLLI